METKLNLILKELKEIKEILLNLKKETTEVKKSCHGMDEHIHFVDKVYSKLRYPLDWITQKFTGKTLPKPKNSLLTDLITS